MSMSLGPLVIAANTATSFQAPNDGVKAILIGNESGLTVTVTMESGGVQKTLYPSMLDWFAVRRGFTGTIKITPAIILNNVSSWPSSSLCFDAIGLNDPEDASQYPIQLNRNTNIGNTVSTTGGTANSIVNDNNAVGTSVLESTPTGVGTSTLLEKNDGTVSFGEYVGGVVTNYFQGTPGANPVLTLGEVAKSVTVRGPLNALSLTATGGGLFLPTGSISAISHFTANGITSTPGDYAHGLGQVPDVVIVSLIGTSTALHMVKNDTANNTSTTVRLLSDSVTTVSCAGLAIKF